MAVAAGMHGSPTVLVAGADVAGAGEDVGSLSCRLYRSATGHDGGPDVETLEAALRAAPHGDNGSLTPLVSSTVRPLARCSRRHLRRPSPRPLSNATRRATGRSSGGQ